MKNDAICPLCGGALCPGATTVTVDYESGVIILRHVPATVCNLCGEAWIDDAVSFQLEDLVQAARRAPRQVEIVDLAA